MSGLGTLQALQSLGDTEPDFRNGGSQGKRDSAVVIYNLQIMQVAKLVADFVPGDGPFCCHLLQAVLHIVCQFT